VAHDIFISYSNLDKEVAEAVCRGLESHGLGCWIAPRDVLPGQEYAAALVQAITASPVFILVLSSHSNNSPQVLREVERAVSKGVPIIPFRIEDVPLSSSMEYYVSSHHWLDALTLPLAPHINTLVTTTSALLATRHKPAAPVAGVTREPQAGPIKPGLPEVVSRPRSGEPKTNAEYALDPENLSEKEFGGGTELSATGFLVFGILTFWIYNAWVYHRVITRHLSWRLDYFMGLVKRESLDPKAKEELDGLISNGFRVSYGVKYTVCAMFLAGGLLVAAEIVAQWVYAAGLMKEHFFNMLSYVAIGAAGFLVSAATVWFLSWVAQTMKKHEYHELLLIHFIKAPQNFKVVRPADSFMKRWNRIQNWVTFFLVLSIPTTISPLAAVIHVYNVIERRGDFSLAIMAWGFGLFVLGAIFHLWGTKLLLDIYNEHLHFEAANRHLVTAETRHGSGGKN
jgi:hypothetical protein